MKPIDLVKARQRHAARLSSRTGSRGESKLTAKKDWLERPKGQGMKNLLAALQETGIKIKATSFDAIYIPGKRSFDFEDMAAVRRTVEKMIFIEIKTTSRAELGDDFAKFFFAITENEIQAADVLGPRHRVALFNAATDVYKMTSVSELLKRAKSRNWQVSISL